MILTNEGEWVVLGGIPSKHIINYIKTIVKPSHRAVVNNCWRVHWSTLPAIVAIARAYNQPVDWSSLPDIWQMFIAGAKSSAPPAPEPQPENPYAVLFVTDDAPFEVIHAAYRALAKKHHSDHGGIDTEMARINEAYLQVKTLRQHE